MIEKNTKPLDDLHESLKQLDQWIGNSLPKMTTPKIEFVPVESVTNANGLGLTVQGMCDELNRVTKQRDELLAALIYHQDQTRPIQRSIDAINNAK